MGKITIIRDEESAWEEAAPDWQAKYSEGDTGLRFKRLLPGGNPTMPNMQRSRYNPDHHEPPHSHPEDEILYILGGTILMGQRTLKQGDALHIPRDTVYTLKAGQMGAEFLRVGFGQLSASSDYVSNKSPA